ncbi:50S ribosomal protein L34e [Candidatus Woesearchaeota archaeon]|nr:50S ribosomal protein L34e [Candidatus Woesearchaeota archaeon]
MEKSEGKMPEPKNRTHSVREIKVKTPGGKVVLQFRRRKPKLAHCSSCRAKLPGIPSVVGRMSSLSRSQRRPERPFAGKLCSACARKVFMQKARSIGASS